MSTEQEILDRIYSRWPEGEGLTRKLPFETKRYYLAYAAGAQWAVLRLKTMEQLEEWQQRQWRLFVCRPTIADVTLQVFGLIEAILTMGREETRFVNVWALLEPEVRFIATGRESLPPSEAIPLSGLAPAAFVEAVCS